MMRTTIRLQARPIELRVSFIRKEAMQGLAVNRSMPDVIVDSAGNRAARKYTRSEQLRRVLWGVASWSIRLSPRPFFAWRRALLRLFGARVGAHVHVYPGTRIVMPWNVELRDWCALGHEVVGYSLGRITIGAHATVSYRAHLCAGTHDFSRADLPLLKPP